MYGITSIKHGRTNSYHAKSWTDGHRAITPALTTPSAPKPMPMVRSWPPSTCGEINSFSSYPHNISSPQLPVLNRWSRSYYTTMDHSLGTLTDADGPISVPPGLAVKLNEINSIS